jgi:adenine deaminase
MDLTAWQTERGESPEHAVNLERFIAVARGEEPADLVIHGGQIINVFSAEIHRADVAIAGGRVVGFGAYEGHERLDAAGAFIAPGFIDAHIHLESTMLTPREFARVVVPMGTTTVVADPHEIANVLGLDGINYLLESSRDLPVTVCFMLPPCVPATNLETAGARLGAREIGMLLPHPRVLGVAEVMNYPAVLQKERELLDKLRLGRQKRIDGHAPGLSGKDLNAYVGVGIKSDHECTTPEEALEKLRAGMHVFIREGTIGKNLEALLPIVTPSNAVRCGLVSDDRHPTDLLAEGHINYLLQRAVALGLPPVTAVQMVTINPAKYFFTTDIGAVAPGYRADLVLLEDLTKFRARVVLKAGRSVARDGALVVDLPPPAQRGHYRLEPDARPEGRG